MNRRSTFLAGIAVALALVPAAALAGGNVRVHIAGVDKPGDQRLHLDLVVEGDYRPNELLISFGGPNVIDVEGLNGTTINGRAEPDFFFIDDDVHIDLRGGEDVLTIRGAVVPGDVGIDLGSDDDVFTWTGGSLHSLFVSGASSADAITVDSLTIGGDLKIAGNDGRDALSVTSVTVGGKTSLDGDSGDDTFLVDGLQQGGRFSLNAGDGNDGALVLDSHFGASATLELDARDDHVTLQEVTADDAVGIDGGGGVDTYTDGGGNAFRRGLQLKRIETVE